MTWKYDLQKQDDGFIVVERFEDGCYAELSKNDWYFETKEEAVKVLSTILEDLKK